MRLQQRQPDGHPLRSHLLAAAANGAPADPRLTEQPPAGCLPLWRAFVDMAGARQIGMGGMGMIPPSEMQAWQAGRGVRLRPWELDTLAEMDRATLALAAPPVAGRPPAQGEDA